MEERISGKSYSFNDRCTALGLNSQATSMHTLECVERGLDPKKTSSHAISCLKHNLDPETTSTHKLRCVILGLPLTASINEVKAAE